MVWDLPTRLFHWGFAISIIGAFISGERGALLAHELFGLAALGLLVFRLIWGAVGHETARFRHIIPAPTQLWVYIRQVAARRIDMPIMGHNPLGGLAVIALLTVMGVMAVTGLWTGDDILYDAPLTVIGIAPHLATPMGAWHERLHFLVPLLVVLHIAAILAHRLWLGEKLLTRMISGGEAALMPEHKKTKYGLVLLTVCVTASLSLALLTPNYG